VAYRVEYSPEATEHLADFDARQQRIVVQSVIKSLSHQPDLQSRNRKKTRPNTIARWELRIGEIRVYYDIEQNPDAHVEILAIGIKTGSVVRIAGEIVEL
jgi:mRNA-degrading endonuclease RelE of RelBE toxin-antitoxin system